MIVLFFFQIILTQACDEPILIVGGGMAGLAAASEAVSLGATNVIIFDKEAKVGGNSAKATSGINGPMSKVQVDTGIDDSVDLFAYDTMVSGNLGKTSGIEMGSPNSLVDTLSRGAASAIAFLSDKGADVTNLVQLGGHAAKRTHRPQGGKPAGWTFVSAVKNSLEDKIKYRTGHNVDRLLLSDNRQSVVGLTFTADKKGMKKARTIILATGGYGNDHTDSSLLQKHRPDLVDVPTTNGPWATGDGVKLGTSIGAATVDMEAVQVHPTGFVDPKNRDAFTKFLAPEAIRGSGALLLNAQGERFVNELDLRSKIVEAERKQTGPLRLLLNPQATETFGPGMKFYEKVKGFASRYDSLAGVAEAMGVDVSTLESVIIKYQEGMSKGVDEFGKTVFPASFSLDEEFYLIAEITPVIHYTMGGLKIDSRSQILGENDVPIGGLFGAGEVTGGVHGKNRLAGNSLLECVVYGRIAGKEAYNHACPNKDEL